MDELADRSADAAVAPSELLAKGYREYRRYSFTLTGDDGALIAQTRDVMHGGRVVAVLPLDIARGEVVLVRQFRLPAHLGNGRGDMVEIVAGRVEPGEDPAGTARRECEEEIGVTPSALVRLFDYLTSPGITDEQVTVFAAAVDAAKVPPRTAHDGEYIRTMRVSVDDALAALARNAFRASPAIVALQWLALNRASISALLRG